MSNRFTERAQRIILIAQEESKRLRSKEVEPAHVLLALLTLGEGTGFLILSRNKVDIKSLRLKAEDSLKPDNAELLHGEAPFTSRAKRVLELAVDEANSFWHGYVGTEHILLGLLGEESSARILQESGLTTGSCRQLVLDLERGRKRVEPWNTPPALASFLRNEVFSTIMHPQVTGLLMAHKPTPEEGRRNVLLILLREGADFNSVHKELAKTLDGFERLNVEYKLPGKRPLMWVEGKWQEDGSIDKTLTY